jgi:hypothetical protein
MTWHGGFREFAFLVKQSQISQQVLPDWRFVSMVRSADENQEHWKSSHQQNGGVDE